MKFFLISLLLPLFAGCTSIPVADSSLDAQAKEFKTNPNGAYLYVYRNEGLGAAVKMNTSS